MIQCVLNFKNTPLEHNVIKSYLSNILKQALGEVETPRLSELTNSTGKEGTKRSKGSSDIDKVKLENVKKPKEPKKEKDVSMNANADMFNQ